MFRSSERPFGIDNPIVVEQYSQPRGEGARFGERQQAVVELEFTAMEGTAESSNELAAEDAANQPCIYFTPMEIWLDM